MSEPLDETSQRVAERLTNARNLLSETERILDEKTTDQHRTQWPNVYRLESAAQHAQAALTWTDPRITRESVADELVASATQARDTMHEAVTSGGGSLIDAANRLLDVTAQIELSLPPSEDDVRATLARLKDLQNEVATTKSRVDQLISDQDSKFAEAEEKRDARFGETIHKSEDDLSQARLAFERRATEAREHITELEDDISKTAAEIGGRAIATDNEKESAEQTSRAFWWTVLTVVLLIAAAAIPILIGIENSEQTPEAVAGKITVALILAGIAGYTAGVARHHRQRAATARRLAIELSAFGPFIAPLDKGDRDDLRSTIVWRFFGPPEAVNQDADAEPTPGPRIMQLLNPDPATTT